MSLPRGGFRKCLLPECMTEKSDDEMYKDLPLCEPHWEMLPFVTCLGWWRSWTEVSSVSKKKADAAVLKQLRRTLAGAGLVTKGLSDEGNTDYAAAHRQTMEPRRAPRQTQPFPVAHPVDQSTAPRSGRVLLELAAPMTCTTCPRLTDGAPQCDRCLLRYAHQVQGVHQRTARPPVLITESQQEKGIIDQVTRAVLRAQERQLREQRDNPRPKKPRRKIATPRAYKGRLEIGDVLGGWTVVALVQGGAYRVRCPLCPAETDKNRTMMTRHSACRSCANKQGKRGSVTR